MNFKLKTAAFAIMVLPLAACVEDTGSAPAAGRATIAEVEQACVARLAQEASVSPSTISVTNSTGSTEGSAVFLNLGTAPWICRADGAGNITGVEFQGEG